VKFGSEAKSLVVRALDGLRNFLDRLWGEFWELSPQTYDKQESMNSKS
jgi:hypothetical protein